MVVRIYRISPIGICLLAVFWLMMAGLAGCTVKLISDYDETTDRTVSALQRKTESHLVALENVENSPD